jgi:monoamine oxidase
MAEAEKAISPLALFGRFLLKDDPLVDYDDWQKPQFTDIDAMSLKQYLQSKGASAEAMRLMEVAVPGWTLDDQSALDTLRKNHFYVAESKRGPYHVVRDGSDALTTAMAASLKQKVELNRIVTGIDSKAKSVTVHFKDGSSRTARTCISTIPLSVMRGIKVAGPATAEQRAAWSRQRYFKTVIIHVKVKSPFWEKDGLPANMWTDGQFELFIHTPSLADPAGNYVIGVNGSATAPLDKLAPAELGRRALAELVRLRPAAAGEVEVALIHNWSTYPFALGHIGYFGPGDLTKYGDVVGAPVGALHFAGEHLSRLAAGMEGACESADNAVQQIFNAIEPA